MTTEVEALKDKKVSWAELPHQDQVSTYIFIYVSDRAFVFVFYRALLSSCKYFPVTNDQIERISQDNVFTLLS